MKAEAKKLGWAWADRATGGGCGGKWVSRGSVGLTLSSLTDGSHCLSRTHGGGKFKMESKLHGVGVGGGGGVVGVDECTEWVSLCLASLLSVSPLYSLLFFPFFTLVFLLSP